MWNLAVMSINTKLFFYNTQEYAMNMKNSYYIYPYFIHHYIYQATRVEISDY